MKKRFIRFIQIIGLISLAVASLSAGGLLASQDTVACPGFMASRLVVGEQGRVVAAGSANNVRSQAASSGEKLGQIPPGGAFVILEGPVCAEGLAWWRVDYNGVVGWTAEGSGTDYWLEPAGPLPTQAATLTPFPSATPEFPETATCPGFLLSRMVVGERGRVVPGPSNNLRAEPASDTELLAEIPGGGQFLVIEGPLCAGGLAWWRVDYYGKIGWTPEGSKDKYWLEPAGPVPTQAPTLTPSITPTPYPTYTPAPTWTPAPAMPPVIAFNYDSQLVSQELPADREAITAANIHRLRPLSIVGRGGIGKVVWSPDGHTVAILNGLGVWLNQLDSEQSGTWLDTDEMLVTSAAFSPDGKFLAIGGKPYLEMTASTLQIWDIETGERLPLYRTFTENVTAILFSSADSCCLYVATRPARYDEEAKVLAVSTQDERTRDLMHLGGTVNRMVISPDGNLLAVSDNYSTVALYSFAARKHQITYSVDSGLGEVMFNAASSQLIAGGSGGAAQTPGVLRVWDIATSKRIFSPQFSGYINHLALSPDGKLLVLDTGSKLLFLDADTFVSKGDLPLPIPSSGATFMPDGKVALSHLDGTLRLWNIDDGTDEIVLDYGGLESGDLAAISPDGRWLALAQNRTREISLWDTETHQIVGTFNDDIRAASYLAFDPDGVELHFTIGNRRYIWTLGQDAPEQTAAEFTSDQIDYAPLVDTAQTYYRLGRQTNIRQAMPVPNTPLLMVNDTQVALTAWDKDTRLPQASFRFFGDLVGFSADGTVMVTRTQGALWLWGI